MEIRVDKESVQRINKALAKINAKVDDLIELAAVKARDTAVVKVPVRTGSLQKSISLNMIDGGYEVAPGMPYAPYVEFGTGQRGAETGAVPGAPMPTFMYGDMGGVPARPFMRPAYLAARQVIEDHLDSIVKK